MDAMRVKRLRECAGYLMDTEEWEFAEELSTRDKKTFGYSVAILTFDYATGMPYWKIPTRMKYSPTVR